MGAFWRTGVYEADGGTFLNATGAGVKRRSMIRRNQTLLGTARTARLPEEVGAAKIVYPARAIQFARHNSPVEIVLYYKLAPDHVIAWRAEAMLNDVRPYLARGVNPALAQYMLLSLFPDSIFGGTRIKGERAPRGPFPEVPGPRLGTLVPAPGNWQVHPLGSVGADGLANLLNPATANATKIQLAEALRVEALKGLFRQGHPLRSVEGVTSTEAGTIAEITTQEALDKDKDPYSSIPA